MAKQIAIYTISITPSYEFNDIAIRIGVTHKELEVYSLVAAGKTYRGIAKDLRISHQSVKNHIYKVNHKLGARNNSQALIFLLIYNLIKIGFHVNNEQQH